MLQSPSAHFNGKMTVNEVRGQNHSEAPIVDPQEKSGVTNKGGTGLALYDDTAKPELCLFYLPWRRWRGTHTRVCAHARQIIRSRIRAQLGLKKELRKR